MNLKNIFTSLSPTLLAKMVGSRRWQAASPEQREGLLAHAASTRPITKPSIKYPAPGRQVASGKPSSFSGIALRATAEKLNDGLEELNDALVRYAAKKNPAPKKLLRGLDLAAAATKLELQRNGFTAFSGDDVSADDAVTMNPGKICKRSKPSQNPAFVPEPSVDVRLRECRAYYEELIAENEVEYQAALKAGRIPQELLYRRSRTQKEFTLALDKIRGVDVRSK
jgi:hypothetical protein